LMKWGFITSFLLLLDFNYSLRFLSFVMNKDQGTLDIIWKRWECSCAEAPENG